MATDLRAHLLAALAAVAPVTNLDIGSPTDRTTWRVGFASAATDAQKAAAVALIASYVDVADSVSRRQGRLALAGAGLLAAVEAAVAKADVATQIWYSDADSWFRADPIVNRLAADPTLNLSAAQVDGLFIAAATL